MARIPSKSKAQREAEEAELRAAERGRRLWKVLGQTCASLAGLVAVKGLRAVWKTATGHAPPGRPEHPDLGTSEAIVWAALSGMAMGVAKMYATRRAAIYWVKTTGSLPPGMSTNVRDESTAS